MKKSYPFAAAALFLAMIFVLSPLYSLARDRYERDDDDNYEREYIPAAQPTITAPQVTTTDTSAYDATAQQLNTQNTALEARRQQLEQQRAQQQQLADQLTDVEGQLNAQRTALEAKAKELAQRKSTQDAIAAQLNDLERQLSSNVRTSANTAYTSGGVYTVRDDNHNGINDVIEGFTKLSFR